jgi:hypothetical protein
MDTEIQEARKRRDHSFRTLAEVFTRAAASTLASVASDNELTEVISRSPDYSRAMADLAIAAAAEGEACLRRAESLGRLVEAIGLKEMVETMPAPPSTAMVN